MTSEPVKKAPFQGSIRAEDRELFHKSVTTKIGVWSYDNNLHGTFSERCLTTKLIDLFKKVNVKYRVEDNPEPGEILVDKIPGVDQCEIEQDGRAHVKIKFEGITQSQFEHRRDRIKKFLDSEQIPSEGLCIFVCITGAKQMELTDEYMKNLERMTKR